MNFNEAEKIIEEGKFKKAVAGALLGATLASSAMIKQDQTQHAKAQQQYKVRTRNLNRNNFADVELDYGKPTELKDTILQLPELYTKEDSLLPYSMTVKNLKNKEGDYLKNYLEIQKQYQNKKITREEAVKKLVDGGILSDKQAKCQPVYWDVL